MKRGMTVAALTEFMLEQGPSKNSNLMEWDKIWALNRKILDRDCHRYTVINSTKKVDLEIIDTDDKYFDSIESQLHPKNKEQGNKLILKGRNLLLEDEDLDCVEVG